MTKQQDLVPSPLYWDRFGQTAAILRQEGFFDGQARQGLAALTCCEYMGELSIGPAASGLSTVAYRCQYAPAIRTGITRLDHAKEILLGTSADPVAAVLQYLNRRRTCELRVVTAAYPPYSGQVTAVKLAGADPGDVGWLYYGAPWSEEEMIPLEEMFHRIMRPYANVCWEVQKVPAGFLSVVTAPFFASRSTSGGPGIGAQDPASLAQDIERRMSHDDTDEVRGAC